MTTRLTPRLDSLLDRVCLATADGPGSKAELARIIEAEAGITFQAAKNRITRILARRSTPNGEDTLILAEWLASRTAPGAATHRGRTRNA